MSEAPKIVCHRGAELTKALVASRSVWSPWDSGMSSHWCELGQSGYDFDPRGRRACSVTEQHRLRRRLSLRPVADPRSRVIVVISAI